MWTVYEHAVSLQSELVTLLFIYQGSKHASTKKEKYVHLANVSTKKHEMIQRHSSRCELKIKLDLPCNGTTMTFFPLFPQKTSKSIGITPGKLWNCSWSQCLNIDIMNIYSNWIIHSAIKWGTFWHERRPVSDGHLTTVILRLKRKNNDNGYFKHPF